MENSDEDGLLLLSLSRTQSLELNTDIAPDPEQEQQFESEADAQPESNQEMPEPSIGPQTLTYIEFRMQQLHDRRFLLLRTESFRNRAGYNSGSTTEEMPCEDSDDLSELEAIRRSWRSCWLKGGVGEPGKQRQYHTKWNYLASEMPYGGVYMLPPSQLNQEQTIKTGTITQIPLDSILPVERLGRTSVITRCPFCQEIIATKISRSVSESMWLLCCLCSMMGCIGGCCLIPFFTDSLKEVKHQCPHCQTHIHTYQPF
ncbi:hypothetical protein Q5P01_023797 [Channa striata]|uniref:LITAF domain-containing protein n=1 Tax=Channa striata TaxID=64152 RepID=A0AA88JAN8_CHASR|nr:hypothetical protein Q5P01_023797 [Channa striata]